MPLYIKGSNVVVFLHIPKCAGTTIERILSPISDLCMLFNDSSAHPFPCSTQHFHADLLRLICPVDVINSFAIVRHPVTRFLSEYAYRCRSVEFENINFSDAVNKCLFEFRMDSYVYDNHIRPQIYFLTQSTSVFRMEDQLDQAISYVSSNLDLDIKNYIDKEHANKSFVNDFCIKGQDINRLQSFYTGDFDVFCYKKISIGDNETILASELKHHIASNLCESGRVCERDLVEMHKLKLNAVKSDAVLKSERLARFLTKKAIKVFAKNN